jgi:signal transduction histidine kinase
MKFVTHIIHKTKSNSIMQKIFTRLTYFLHPSFHQSVIRHRKATILIFSHIFVIIALISLLLLSKTIEKVALIPAFCAVPLMIGSLFYFKNKGHINLSGNILTIIWYAVLFPILLKTGGLNSSFIPWLYSIILMMVLVESYIWSTFWFVVASLSCLCLYIGGRFFPPMNISNCSDTDTLISYLTVGFFMFTNLALFESHQVFVIKILKEKNDELKAQKQAIAEHAFELEKIQKKLKESNQELEIFAYAASHDLKEPLRMITMYTQLMERRIKTMLDGDTTEYMFFITDGVKRMQKLLDNLLEYSLLGKNIKDNSEVDLNDKMKKVTQNLTVLIQETNAKITYSNLPTIVASVTQMSQLFQNLIANALKFRKPNVEPVIDIGCMENPNEYLFAISDNGIGIKKEDQERIFTLFTRLHSHTQYEGTGIGLATCKKILTNLNGKIWVSSTEGVGTTFYFTIPKVDASVLDENVNIEANIVEEVAAEMK